MVEILNPIVNLSEGARDILEKWLSDPAIASDIDIYGMDAVQILLDDDKSPTVRSEILSYLAQTIPSIFDRITYVTAFHHWEDLVKIDLPSTVTHFGDCAFWGCASLKEVVIPDSIDTIPEYCFYSCRKLTNIILPANLKEIESRAFEYCENLRKIEIPKGTTKLQAQAFCYCDGLKSILIPESVKRLEVDAFHRCPHLTIYTDNTFVMDYCDKHVIDYRPASEFPGVN